MKPRFFQVSVFCKSLLRLLSIENFKFIPLLPTEFYVLKACVCYFLSKFYFSPNDSPSKTMKNVFYFIEKALFIVEIFKSFVYSSSPLFSLSAIALEDDSRKILSLWYHQLSKYEINNTLCLIHWERNEVWHWNFVHWYSIKYRTFLWKNHAEDGHQKLVPDPSLILLNNPNQPWHAKNYF